MGPIKEESEVPRFLMNRSCPFGGDVANSPSLRADGKRKASDEPSSPTASKRAKHSEDLNELEKKRAIKPIPFPEKVD